MKRSTFIASLFCIPASVKALVKPDDEKLMSLIEEDTKERIKEIQESKPFESDVIDEFEIIYGKTEYFYDPNCNHYPKIPYEVRTEKQGDDTTTIISRSIPMTFRK